MNCAECKELLVGFIEGFVDESERLKICEHFSKCPSCKAELTKLEKMHERLVLNGKAFSESDFEEDVFNRIVREQKIRLEKAGIAGKTISLRRIIMRSPITKFAIAAVIVVAAILSINIIDRSVPAAFGIDQVIDAYNNIRFLHVKQFDANQQDPARVLD